MNRLRRATRLLLAAGAGLLVACGPAPGEAPMSGYAEAELVFVAPPTAGLLQTLAVQRGDRVGTGQLLYKLEADAQTLARDAAAARQERAEAQAQNLRKGKRPAELQAIDQQLAQARAAQAVSQAALQRQQQLVAQGFVSALRLDELVAARDRDAARVQELQAQRVLASEAARSDEIAAAAAEARAGSADLALAAWREGQMQRTAPAEALVYDVLYRVGEWVPAGAPVVSLLPPGALKLRFFVPEAMLAQAVVGREVTVSCDGCAAGLRARIRYVSPQAEFTPPVIYSNDSRSKLVFMAEAEPAAAADLKPGQPVDVRFAKAP
ncbi:MAG: HlyD family efflux transporter periplasmic adaptor subunit [Rubrivivax sp.]|nr:HlyD family efflux transporter periplasmic adaptor subunit [Betaproteobacteria bacterium]MBP6318264.1 HlyD family efflux transporter periplasmic adaptor subunit [Rubrivivax sp.]MBK7276705.1 HlyD family efflux transporter periplasmic adaptor subunit [Betaproteobacteria bacterium]MBK7458523.1 HlyD family efflux transporter periplasmic adaptor subunit [Betaproteobacteria bacterium]MBK7517066.1 HlyD family efflux transporter periplasmic adaptor subunit [Betaproteobacteria bacterium]